MENENQEKQNTLVNIDDKVVGEVELPKLDLSEYIGNKTVIDKVETHESKFGYFVKVISRDVAVIERENEDNIILTASKLFGLVTMKDGTVGWGSESKLAEFLAKHKVTHYKDLVGKEIIVQMDSNKGKDFLTFN